jgi:hypothetical protein
MATIITGPNPAFAAQFQQPQDTMGNLARLQQLREQIQNAPMRDQLLHQQLQNEQTHGQAEQIGLQQAQQGQQDQQAFRAAMADPSMHGKTMGEVADALAGKGALSPATYQNSRNPTSSSARLTLNLDKPARTLKEGHDANQTLYNNVMQMPDDQMQANWGQIAKQYDAIPGNQKMPLDPSKPMSKQELQQYGPFISMNEAYLDQQLNKRKATAEATTAENNASFGPTGPAAEAKYRFILQKKAAGGKLSPEEQTYAQSYEASEAKATTSSDTLGVTSSNVSRPAGLSMVHGGPQAGGGGARPLPSVNAPSSVPGSPVSAKQGIVDLVGQYRYDPAQLSRLVAKHPDILASVQQKYPDFDQTTYQAKNKMLQSYTSGTESKSINAINTAMGHVKVLDDAVEALNNGNMQALNALGNKLGVATGTDAQTTFRAIVHRVGPEITSAYLPGGGGEAERIANEKDFSENMAPQQLHANAAVTVKLLRSKVGALQNQYKNTVGRDDFEQRFITPEAQAAFQKFGGAAAGAAPQDGATKTNAHGDPIVFKGGKWQLAQ